jgi:hypothetical protein
MFEKKLKKKVKKYYKLLEWSGGEGGEGGELSFQCLRVVGKHSMAYVQVDFVQALLPEFPKNPILVVLNRQNQNKHY